MGIYERVLESKSKGHELNKNGLPCLLGISCQVLCAIFWSFQYDSSGF